ncbi:aldo/keto reductase [Neobacillus sp. LXY-4]|uniref:aldo/keto reductase n=1 Tax=Neobacillus sp. LXY-4 TaxID=3379826 RepID=UPI003EDF4DE7
MSSIQDTVRLNNGVEMPKFGLGVYKVEEGQQTENTVRKALELGYRSIDTAAFYQNEEGVGKAVKESGIPREKLFITTKVWNSDQGYDSTIDAFEKSMRKLNLEYLDLYLVHWPVIGKYLETWRALETLYQQGKVRAIGVSNFQIHHLQDIFDHFQVRPAINQIELHPKLAQPELRAFCKKHGIFVEAWSPIARGRYLDEPVLMELAEKHGKTAAQVILRWHLQNYVIIIPKSITEARLKENADIFDFELSLAEMENINLLNENKRFGADPDHVDF